MVKLATVGTGWIVDMFLEAVKQADPEFVHTAVYSFREEEGQAFAKKHGVEHVYTDLDELGKSDVDVIYILQIPMLCIIRLRRKCWNMANTCFVKKPL